MPCLACFVGCCCSSPAQTLGIGTWSQIAYLALQPRNVMLQRPTCEGGDGGGGDGGLGGGSVVKLVHFKEAQQLPANGGVVVDIRPASMLR